MPVVFVNGCAKPQVIAEVFDMLSRRRSEVLDLLSAADEFVFVAYEQLCLGDWLSQVE